MPKFKALTSRLFKDQSLRRTSFSKSQLITFAAVFAVIGGYIIWRSFAAGPTIVFHPSLDTAYAGESVQLVWDFPGATSCTGSGTYSGQVLLIDTNDTQGKRFNWTANNLPASGSARTLPLFETAFKTDTNGNAPHIFTISCNVGGSKTMQVNYRDINAPGEKGARQGSFNIHCELIPNANGDTRDDPSVGGNDPLLSPKQLDPIVFPGVPPPAGHMHEFFGNKRLAQTLGDTTPQSLLQGLPSYRGKDPTKPNWSSTSCKQQGPDDPTIETRNGSAYWPPTQYVCDAGQKDYNDPTNPCLQWKDRFDEATAGNPWGRLSPSHLQIYYRNKGDRVIESFPTGLKVITGPVFKDGPLPSGMTYQDADINTVWRCLGSYLYTTSPDGVEAQGSGNQRSHCDSANIMEVNFPVCWDGVRLDSLKDLWGNDFNPNDPSKTNYFTGRGLAHHDHLRKAVQQGSKTTCAAAFTDLEKVQISKILGLGPDTNGDGVGDGIVDKGPAENDTPALNDLIREFTSLNFIMRYEREYKPLGGGPTIKLDQNNSHLFWYAQSSRDLSKETWVKSFPECPTKLGVTSPTYCPDGDPAAKYPMDLVDSLHADYFFGWDPLRLDFLTHNCLNKKNDCKGSDLEGVGQHGPGTMPPAGPFCSDGIDNDGDGKVDSADPDCSSQYGNAYNPADNSESTDKDDNGDGKPDKQLFLLANGQADHITVAPNSYVSMVWTAENFDFTQEECVASDYLKLASKPTDWRTLGNQVVVQAKGNVGDSYTYTITCGPTASTYNPAAPAGNIRKQVVVTLGISDPGSTVDTVAAFNQAINNATGGETITLAGRDWEHLDISGKNFSTPVTIRGITDTKLKAGLNITDSTNIVLTDFTVTPGSGDSSINISGNSANITMDDLKIQGAPGTWPPPISEWQPDPDDPNGCNPATTCRKKPDGHLTGKKSNIDLAYSVHDITVKNSSLSNCVSVCLSLDQSNDGSQRPNKVTVTGNNFSTDNFPGLQNHFLAWAGDNVSVQNNHFDFNYSYPDGGDDPANGHWGNGGGGVCDQVLPPGRGNQGCAHQDPEHIRVSSGTGWDIEHNWFGNNEEHGAQLKLWATSEYVVAPHNVTISSNIFRSNRTAGFAVDVENGCGVSGDSVTNIKITNNTMTTNNSSVGIGSSFDGCLELPTVANNIISLMGRDDCSRAYISSNVARDIKDPQALGSCNSGFTKGNPQLKIDINPSLPPTDPASYAPIQPSPPDNSLVINNANQLYAPPTDYYGLSRVGLADIGAIEFREYAAPTVSLHATPTQIPYGATTSLDWTVSNAASCSASASPDLATWNGDKNASTGSHSQSDVGPLTADTAFTLECTNDTDSAVSTVTVTVGAQPAPPPQPGPGPAIVGDLDGNNRVDVFDLSILLSHYGKPGPIGDIDKKGIVDVVDLSILLTHYGQHG